MYVHGMSTRDIEATFADVLSGTGVSKSVVSRVTQCLSDDFEVFRKRDLSSEELLYLELDGTFLRYHQGAEKKEPILVATGLRHLDRHRSFAGENSMRFIPVTTAFLLRRLRSVLVVASTQRFRHLTLQCVLKHHLRSRPNDLRQIHIPEYQSFLKLLEQSLTW